MTFTQYIEGKGYFRYQGCWYFDKKLVSGKVLSDILKEYKEKYNK